MSAAGVGTAIGYLGAAVVKARASRRTRADEASVVVDAANTIVGRLLERNASLAHTNMLARAAMSKLVMAVQLALDRFEELPPEQVRDIQRNVDLMVALQAALDAANAVEL